MSPTYIALIILFGVAIVAGLAFGIQDYENKKRAKRLRLMALKSAARRAAHILDAFPAILMSSEIHSLLCRYIANHWKAIIEIEPNEANQAQQATYNAKASTAPEKVALPAESMKIFAHISEASRSLSVIKEFAKFVAEITNKGELNSEQGEHFTKEAKRLYMRAEIDIDLFQVAELEENQPEEVVVHHYRSCLHKLQSINFQQSLDIQINSIALHIEKLTQAIDTHNEAKRIAEQEAQDTDKKFNF